jgi:hypothetical protein
MNPTKDQVDHELAKIAHSEHPRTLARKAIARYRKDRMLTQEMIDHCRPQAAPPKRSFRRAFWNAAKGKI